MKTLKDAEVGDILIQKNRGQKYKILAKFDKFEEIIYLLSAGGNFKRAFTMYTVNDLEEHGLTFYQEEPKRWKPEIDQTCWFIDCQGDVFKFHWIKYYFQQELYDFGNCFKTKEEAEVARDRIKKLLTEEL